MRLAGPEDLPEVQAFLAARVAFAMFPLSNLLLHGLGGSHPHGGTIWLRREGGQVVDVLTLSNAGMVMPLMADPSHLAALKGREVSGLIGPREAVRALAPHLQPPHQLDCDEPHFQLDLAQMTLPEGPGRIVPLDQAPQEVMLDWLADYVTVTSNHPEPRAEAKRRLASQAATHVCLMEGDRPLSMTGFNARLPGIVQVGGVYTPPALRGHGLARRALGLHLAQVQAQGVTQAVLFAATPAAAQAYRALGFRQIGDWSILLTQRQVVHG